MKDWKYWETNFLEEQPVATAQCSNQLFIYNQQFEIIWRKYNGNIKKTAMKIMYQLTNDDNARLLCRCLLKQNLQLWKLCPNIYGPISYSDFKPHYLIFICFHSDSTKDLFAVRKILKNTKSVDTCDAPFEYCFGEKNYTSWNMFSFVSKNIKLLQRTPLSNLMFRWTYAHSVLITFTFLITWFF